jgi:hypothetical protein
MRDTPTKVSRVATVVIQIRLVLVFVRMVFVGIIPIMDVQLDTKSTMTMDLKKGIAVCPNLDHVREVALMVFARMLEVGHVSTAL